MRFRKLRIAFSVVCAVVCLLLIALWVRSGHWLDDIALQFHDNLYVQLSSSPGTCWISVCTGSLASTPWTLFSTSHDDSTVQYMASVFPPASPLWGEFGQKFANYGGPREATIGVPYWFAVPIVAIFGAAPWLRWRFSLRTLLIGMTLIAGVLGLIVWLGS